MHLQIHPSLALKIFDNVVDLLGEDIIASFDRGSLAELLDSMKKDRLTQKLTVKIMAKYGEAEITYNIGGDKATDKNAFIIVGLTLRGKAVIDFYGRKGIALEKGSVLELIMNGETVVRYFGGER